MKGSQLFVFFPASLPLSQSFFELRPVKNVIMCIAYSDHIFAVLPSLVPWLMWDILTLVKAYGVRA